MSMELQPAHFVRYAFLKGLWIGWWMGLVVAKGHSSSNNCDYPQHKSVILRRPQVFSEDLQRVFHMGRRSDCGWSPVCPQDNPTSTRQKTRYRTRYTQDSQHDSQAIEGPCIWGVTTAVAVVCFCAEKGFWGKPPVSATATLSGQWGVQGGFRDTLTRPSLGRMVVGRKQILACGARRGGAEATWRRRVRG